MKIRSELQRYLSNNYINLLLMILSIIVVSFLPVEYSIIILTSIFIWLLYRRRINSNNIKSRIRIIEKSKVDSDSNIILINYNGYNYLILANKNSLLKITEEREDAQLQ